MIPPAASRDDRLFRFALRLGDDRLILGHRLSEWCGHAHSIEEDLALANIALDCLGQAANFLKLAGRFEGKGRTEDDLAYFREAVEFENARIVEQPNGDFAFTTLRLFIYSVYADLLYSEIERGMEAGFVAIAAKARKEIAYHLRHSREWTLRLGLGTVESRARAQSALNALWPLTSGLFFMDQSERQGVADGLLPDLPRLEEPWRAQVAGVFKAAEIDPPRKSPAWEFGLREGRHSEHLGHLLAEMQIVARSYPSAKW